MKQSEQHEQLSHPNITNIQLRLDSVTKILLLQEKPHTAGETSCCRWSLCCSLLDINLTFLSSPFFLYHS